MGAPLPAPGWLAARSTAPQHRTKAPFSRRRGSSPSSLAPALRFAQDSAGATLQRNLCYPNGVFGVGGVGVGEETPVPETKPLVFLEMKTRRAGWGCTPATPPSFQAYLF